MVLFKNLYIRGISTLKRLKSRNREEFLGGLFAIFYHAIFSPIYHMKWGFVIPLLILLRFFHHEVAIRYYLLDYTVSWIFALYSTIVLRRLGYYGSENPWMLFKSFNIFYLFFRPLISLITLYCLMKTLFEILYCRVIERASEMDRIHVSYEIAIYGSITLTHRGISSSYLVS